MLFSQRHRVLVTIFVFLLPAASVDAADDLPTVDKIRSAMFSGEFASAVRQANRLLEIKGDLAAGVDRAELYMLRGNAQLAIKQRDAAITSFNLAAKEGTDRKKSALATATAALAQKSPGLKYTPKHKAAIEAAATTQPIDILSDTGRETAFAAMYADEQVEVSPQVKTATSATSLPPVISAMKALRRVQSLEIAATGTDASTHVAVHDVQSHATSLLQSALSDTAAKVQRISTQAHTQVQRTLSSGAIQTGQAGLDTTAISALKDAIVTARKIAAAADDLAALTDSPADNSNVTAQAKAISDQAQSLLTTDWNATESTSYPPSRASAVARH